MPVGVKATNAQNLNSLFSKEGCWIMGYYFENITIELKTPVPLNFSCPSMKHHAQLQQRRLLAFSLLLGYLDSPPHVVTLASLREVNTVDHLRFLQPPEIEISMGLV